ncbi:MAG: ATPase-like protein [Candidatus Magnetoglobus multicellularis str. Araruama]|uniref:ATPase-like protein n=1 Tax=Candidatus Magnetoglobus multicellularis str. Araruama TaxID=890399 RepID=A0A1V1NXX6_9BACT|nr:MAG: ATPase-like protein [Candidatus Magnetoglobus multicellularis str. Araruama]
MIKNINLKNFRCFNQLEIQGFERINLFGGKNNSGKTSLLEALFIGSTPSPKTIINLRQIRGESSDFLKVSPEKAWNYLFYEASDNHRTFSITLEYSDKSRQIDIEHGESFEIFDEIETNDMKSILTESEYKQSALNIYSYQRNKRSRLASVIASSKGILPKTFDHALFEKAIFIPAFARNSSTSLAEEYDKSDLEDQSKRVLQSIQIIDPTILQIKTLTIGKPAIYIKRKNSKYLPITLFGEAVTRVVQFILSMINNNNSILLIDEIETGIHYTNQLELWRMLFKLAIEFNIQIFATTHSYEMIKSFSEAISDVKDDVGSYFEITRDIRTDQIVAVKRTVDILKYELDQKMELRGE